MSHLNESGVSGLGRLSAPIICLKDSWENSGPLDYSGGFSGA